VPLTVLSRWACEQEKVEPIAKSIRPILLGHGADLRVGRIFSGDTPGNGRYTGQFLAAVRYPDWERLGRTMHATVSEAEYQKALAEADRVCELQSRSIVIDIELGYDATRPVCASKGRSGIWNKPLEGANPRQTWQAGPGTLGADLPPIIKRKKQGNNPAGYRCGVVPPGQA